MRVIPSPADFLLFAKRETFYPKAANIPDRSSRKKRIMETIGKARLEALSDGIFAFAMTLLFLSLTIPEIPTDQAPLLLPGRIAGMFPEFMLFVISFFVLAGYWISHHRILDRVRFIDGMLIRMNILLLFLIVLIPFTTALSGDYPDVLEAVLLFHVNLLATSLLLAGMTVYIERKRDILAPGPEAGDRAGRIRNAIITIVFVAAIGVSFLNPAKSMWCYALIPVLIPVSRLIVKKISKKGEK